MTRPAPRGKGKGGKKGDKANKKKAGLLLLLLANKKKAGLGDSATCPSLAH